MLQAKYQTTCEKMLLEKPKYSLVFQHGLNAMFTCVSMEDFIRDGLGWKSISKNKPWLQSIIN